MRQSAVVSVAVLVVRLSGFLPITTFGRHIKRVCPANHFDWRRSCRAPPLSRIPWSLLLAEQTCSKARHEGVAAMKVWESGDEGNAQPNGKFEYGQDDFAVLDEEQRLVIRNQVARLDSGSINHHSKRMVILA
jgi:hypothetical protein